MTKIALHGLPRSGTSWLGEIINSSPNVTYKFQPLFSYILKDFLTAGSSRDEIDDFFSLLEKTADPFLDQTEKRNAVALPVFRKEETTHIAYKEVRYHHVLYNLLRKCPDVRVVCMVRSPLSVINSWLLAPREFRADLGWDALEEWRYALKKNMNKPEEFNGFEKWKEGVRIFLNIKKQHPGRVHIVEYRDLLTAPHAETEKLFQFCGLALERQTAAFITESTSSAHEDPYAVFRKNQTDDVWKGRLPARIAEDIIEDLKGTELEKYLYLDQ
jgi:hypothetical protein